jgi:hypothetical protein
MPSSGMWRSVGLLYTDVSKERVISTFPIPSALKIKATHSSETSVYKIAFFIVTIVKTLNSTYDVHSLKINTKFSFYNVFGEK